MPANIPKYALRPHSFERLAHPVQHIAGARRAPALLCVVFPVPRFIARTVLDESRLVFRRCLASEANIRKNSSYNPESAVCLEQTSDVDQHYRLQTVYPALITITIPISHHATITVRYNTSALLFLFCCWLPTLLLLQALLQASCELRRVSWSVSVIITSVTIRMRMRRRTTDSE